MIQIDLNKINYERVITYSSIVILLIIVFSTCTNNEKMQLTISGLEQKNEISDLKIEKHVNRINALNDKITSLETTKQREKIKIVTVVKEVKDKIEVVGSLNTKGIANYYQDRYKTPIIITQYGVALKDTVAKLNIVELIQKDGLLRELDHTKNILNITENQSKIKDGILILKDSIISEKDNQIDSHFKIEANLTKSVKSERTKKTIWKIVSGGILVGAGYLLVK